MTVTDDISLLRAENSHHAFSRGFPATDSPRTPANSDAVQPAIHARTSPNRHAEKSPGLLSEEGVRGSPRQMLFQILNAFRRDGVIARLSPLDQSLGLEVPDREHQLLTRE